MNYRDTSPWEVLSPEESSRFHKNGSESPKSTSDESNEKSHHAMYHSQLLGSGVRNALCENSKQDQNSGRHSTPEKISFQVQNAPLHHEPTAYENRYDTSRDIVTITEENLDRDYVDKDETKQSNADDEPFYIEDALNGTSCHPFQDNSQENATHTRTLPWMRENTISNKLSMKMIRYFANIELKQQISELTHRETLAVRKHMWTEALRLREMKNKLELLMELNLYNTLLYYFSNKTRTVDRRKIDAKSELIARRDTICTNSSMYDEDAKDIFHQWVHEDEQVGKLDSTEQQDMLLEVMDKEWKHLNAQDRDRVAELYHEVDFKSHLHDEHKLVELVKSTGLDVTFYKLDPFE